MDDQRQPGTAPGLAVQRGHIEAEKTGPGIRDFQFVPGHALPAGDIERRQLGPLQFGQKARDRLAFGDLVLQAEQAGDRLVKVENPPGFIGHQHPVFNGVKQGLQETPFARQLLHDGLEAFFVEPANPAEHLVEEVRGRGGHNQISCPQAGVILDSCRDKASVCQIQT